MNIEHNIVNVPGLKKRVRLFHITDSHIAKANPDEDEYLRDLAVKRTEGFKPKVDATAEELLEEAVRMAEEVNSDCVIFTGDIIDYASQANFEVLDKTLKPLKSCLYVVGNHDYTQMKFPFPAEVAEHYLNVISSIAGTDTDVVVKEIDGVLIIGFDDSDYQVTEEQYQKIKNELDRGLPTVLCCHIPIYTESLCPDTNKVWKAPILLCSTDEALEGKTYGYAKLHPTKSTADFKKMIENSENVVAVLAGHLHFMHIDYINSHLPQFVTGATPHNMARIVDLVPQ